MTAIDMSKNTEIEEVKADCLTWSVTSVFLLKNRTFSDTALYTAEYSIRKPLSVPVDTYKRLHMVLIAGSFFTMHFWLTLWNHKVHFFTLRWCCFADKPTRSSHCIACFILLPQGWKRSICPPGERYFHWAGSYGGMGRGVYWLWIIYFNLSLQTLTCISKTQLIKSIWKIYVCFTPVGCYFAHRQPARDGKILNNWRG